MSQEQAEYRVEKTSNRKRQKQIVIRATENMLKTLASHQRLGTGNARDTSIRIK